jgi:perosamine synthetase
LSPNDQAAPGVPPLAGFIPLIVPEICGNEWKYVKECLDTNWMSSVGSYIDQFETKVAERAGTKYAVAMVSGTAALHIALILAGVEPDDEVLLSSLTFVAPANAVRYVNAWPVFIDSEAKYWQIDPCRVVEFLENECHWDGRELRNRVSGRRVKAILPVHILGHPADLDPIMAIAEKFSLPVIEDATQSLGALYRGKSVGGFGHAGCFSFNGNKIITAGGGGMLVTNDAEWAARARHLANQAKSNPLEYVHSDIGYNYRMSNLLAAIGCAQIEQIDRIVGAKRTNARRYFEALAPVAGVHLPQEADWAFSTYWLYTVLIDEKEFEIDARELIGYLATRNIEARPLWQPMHISPAHNCFGSPACPIAESVYRRAISIPCSTSLSESAQNKVIESIARWLAKHRRSRIGY